MYLVPWVMKDTSFTTQEWFCERLAEPYVNNSFSEPQLTSTWNAADLVHTTVTHPERGGFGRVFVVLLTE